MTQCLCDRFIVERRMGLPTQSTDVTFKSLVHSTGSVKQNSEDGLMELLHASK